MLSSITPLGERGRHQRWGVTVSAFGFGSCVGGALLGALCGSVGALFLALLARLSGTRVLTLSAIGIAAGAAIALSLDALTGRVTVPATTRQVDDQWLYRYRGWVYGGGFGLQLGAGLLTVVPAAIGYFVWILAALTGSPALGGLIGATFGLGRGCALLAGAGVKHPQQLITFHQGMQRQARIASLLVIAVEVAVLCAALALLILGRAT